VRKLDGNFAVGCGLEQTDAIMNEVLEPIMFILEYPTVHSNPQYKVTVLH